MEEEFPTPYIRDMVRAFRERLAQLEPYVQEYRRLEIADQALGGKLDALGNHEQ